MAQPRDEHKSATIDVMRVLITRDNAGGLITEASDLRLTSWPEQITLTGDAGPKRFTRRERIPHPDPEELGGYLYVAEDGQRLTVFND